MGLDEYLQIVAEQIRYQKIRSSVTEELRNHILDDAEYYESQGAFPEEAMERAVREMGDPVATGVSLDHIHRPHMNWGLVALIALISLFDIGFFYIANLSGADLFSWKQQAGFTLIGFLLMIAVYRLDYSMLEIGTWKTCVFYLLLLLLGDLCFGLEVRGSVQIHLGSLSISLSELSFLYVPLFGAALYSFRGDGTVIFAKAIPLLLAPVLFLFHVNVNSAFLLFLCLICLFLFAVWKNWYQINRKKALGFFGGITLLTPALVIGYFYVFGADYQKDRILNLFTRAEENYYFTLTKQIMENSSFFGTSEHSVNLFLSGPSNEYLTDYILASMCSFYGILLTVIIIAALVFLIMKIFHVSVSQKNQLGMIVGTGCGLVFLAKTAAGILVNLQILPYTSIRIPFLSYGGSSTLVSYVLLGLVLSVYRYKNILPANQRYRKLHLKLTWDLH